MPLDLTSAANRLRDLYYPRLYPIILGFLSGFSVFYFLYTFGAYGIQKGLSYSGHSHLFRSISFGLLTFAYLTVFEAWLKPKLNISQLSHTMLWYLSLVLLGSQLIFLLFNFFWNWQEWNPEAYWLIMKEFPLMVVLPLSIYFVLKRILAPQKPNAPYFTFQSKNGKDQLRINPHYFLYASSSENYITVVYTSDGQRKQHLIRKPLKALEQELKVYPEVERTHRSYLVNSRNIEAVKQFKGKVTLEVNGSNIPVSKQYQHHFLKG
ncbi:LytTR family transcriptional regulator DNA-binding domain-containing protein [Phaeodactylibacter sp.]|uniref:LytR/AlgR family response regulator transcription factor n=1 Tax=Phaeodactylibacter sp. TaxID=1940289 RepID=UPI0025FF9004|nr:LytTR family transcriptional regulator DNA-binding domain-containing protein [Phaeodactylibacter sp.]MCI4650198.1 LytTR family transcriptional regulator DNA-binding domain-containing protein [Phaeodactylibacter sp.]MCI5089725.1 LytTR family transcriptional regulator DNA-binding domain-containing protein [Phaeodactylibacter sp.]